MTKGIDEYGNTHYMPVPNCAPPSDAKLQDLYKTDLTLTGGMATKVCDCFNATTVSVFRPGHCQPVLLWPFRAPHTVMITSLPTV